MFKKTRQSSAFPGSLGLAVILLSSASIGPVQAAVDLDADGKIKLFGDMRFRAETDDSTKQDGTDRNRDRLRLRARIGVSFAPNDAWSGKIRLATGSTQGSPHETMETVSDIKGKEPSADFIGLDTALIAYNGVTNLTLIAGKTSLNFWQTAEIWWDKDDNPEALAAVYRMGPVTFNGAYAILKEGKWEDDWSAALYQFVLNNSFANGMKYTLAAGGASLTAEDTNGKDAFKSMSHWIVGGQLEGSRWRAAFDYIEGDADEENTAYVVHGRYQVTDTIGLRAYLYHVETYATPGDGLFTQDNFPSAEASADNFDGYRLQLDYKIANNTYMDLRYYDTEIITKNIDGQDAERSRIQLNLNVKF